MRKGSKRRGLEPSSSCGPAGEPWGSDGNKSRLCLTLPPPRIGPSPIRDRSRGAEGSLALDASSPHSWPRPDETRQALGSLKDPGPGDPAFPGYPHRARRYSYLTLLPETVSTSGTRRWTPDSSSAARTMPRDSTPISLTGSRFATRITCFPTRSASL